MSVNDNVRLIQDGYEAFSRGDIPAVLDNFAEDVVWRRPRGSGDSSLGTKYQGHAGVMQFFQKLAEAEEMLAFEPREFVAQGEKVVVIGFIRSRAKPTGREYEGEWVHVWTIRGGKVVDYQAFFDTAAAEAAFRGD